MKLEEISENINNEFDSISECFSINKLSLHVKKTKFKLFHYHPHNVNSLTLKLAINSEPIERVTEFNSLGLTIDEHLSWISHTPKISNKISCTIDSYTEAYVHLSYSAMYAIFHTNRIGRLDKLQKRSIRTMAKSKYNALSLEAKPFKLKDILMSNILKMYYKYRENSLPSYTANMFSVATCASNYNLHVTKSLTNVNTKTISGDKCIRSYLPKVINETDEQYHG